MAAWCGDPGLGVAGAGGGGGVDGRGTVTYISTYCMSK